MFTRVVFRLIVMAFVITFAGTVMGQDPVQDYFSKTACKVKATTDLSQKREILNKSLGRMSKALDRLQSLPLISKEDRVGIDRIRATLQEKQDELAGLNGYERVSDEQLNAFSDYIVQDMEQAFNNQEGVLALLAILLLLVWVIFY